MATTDDKVRKALAFYADESRWSAYRSDIEASIYDRNTGSDLGRDEGKLAAEALAALPVTMVKSDEHLEAMLEAAFAAGAARGSGPLTVGEVEHYASNVLSHLRSLATEPTK